MKKCLPISLLVSLLCFGAGCANEGNSSSVNPGTSNTSTSSSAVVNTSSSSSVITSSSSSTAKPVVTGVTIEYDGETTVIAGSTAKLSAEVKGVENGKVTWSSSDEAIARVVNGTVSFKNVLEDKEVTITATSRDDNTKSASITFTVKYSSINFANSKGNNIDNSLFLDEGIVEVGVGDTSLMYNGVYGTKWYVEATITPTGFSETDAYPKFGIMTGDSDVGNWNFECKNLFYFVDAMTPASNNSWTALGFVGQNDEKNNWEWSRNTPASVTGDNKVTKNEPFTMGLLRDGVNYYLYGGVGDGYGVIKHIINTELAADEASYAWIGGWASGFIVSNVKSEVGEAVDGRYEDPTTITLGESSQTLYVGDTYQLDYRLDSSIYDPSKLSFTSSDDTVATVSSTGLITAGSKDGTATITVAYGDVKAEFALEVTTDAAFKVLLNGAMDDLIWNENAKANKYTFKQSDDTYIDFYASRNSRGVYLFADYYVKTVKDTTHGDWWMNDNFEGYFGTRGRLTINDMGDRGHDNTTGQCWASANKNSNFERYYISDLVLNEETGFYNMQYELFMSYSRLGVTADDIVTFRMGSNPATGWYQCSWMSSNNLADYMKITENGITFVLDAATTCPEGHNWGDWRATTPVTCTSDGEDTRTCKDCGNSETRPVVSAGQHVYDVADVTVETTSTCNTHGTGKVTCTVCNNEVDAELPYNLDVHNSEGTYTDGAWTCCGNHVETVLENTAKATSGGWDNTATWTYLASNLEGDFTLTARYEYYGNLGEGWNVWQHPLLVVADDDPTHIAEGAPYGDNATFRLDWYGWMDDRNGDGVQIAESQNNGGMFVSNFDAEMPDVIGHSTVDLTVKRVGNDLSIHYDITTGTGVHYSFEQGLTGLRTNILEVALSPEFSTFTVSRIFY